VDLATLLGKLEGVGLQVYENLLDPFLIRLHHQIDIFGATAALVVILGLFFGESDKIASEKYFFGLSLIKLDGDDIFDAAFDVEPFDDLGELSCLQLGESKNVLHVKKKEVGARSLYLIALEHLIMDFRKLIVQLGLHVALKVSYQRLEVHAH
jgi:hypothetical protein